MVIGLNDMASIWNAMRIREVMFITWSLNTKNKTIRITWKK
jgi:hypothetical protein